MADPLSTSKSDFSSEIEASEVPLDFIQNLNAALKSPLLVIPKPFETWMIDKVASSGFDLPISQIVGFTQFLGQESAAGAEVTTTSADVWVDLTGGPSLTGLPNGSYLFFFSATAKISTASGAAAKLGVNVNGTDATDAESAVTFTTVNVTISRVVKKTLSAGNNTVKIRYTVGSGAGETATFSRRELFALKIENL